jgi:hypothetical protein
LSLCPARCREFVRADGQAGRRSSRERPKSVGGKLQPRRNRKRKSQLQSQRQCEQNRILSPFGAEIPLTSLAKAWEPGTFYGLIDVEPFWQIGAGVNMLRFRAGMAYIPNNRVRVELSITLSGGNRQEATPSYVTRTFSA